MQTVAQFEKYYNVLSIQDNLMCYQYLMDSKNWAYKNASDRGGDRFWYNELNDPFFTEFFLNRIESITNINFMLKAVYANGQTSGQNGSLHIDDDDINSYTFLYYVNPNWIAEWGGGTVFSIDGCNQTAYSFFEPNSAILFKSNLIHAGLEPTTKFKGLRISVAFKLKELH